MGRKRGRGGYMQVLSELWRSSRYINSFISAADSAGFLGYGKPRLSWTSSVSRRAMFTTGWFTDFRRVGRWARRGNEPFDQENMRLVFFFFYGVPRRDCAARNVFFPRIPVFGEIFGSFAKSGHGNRGEIGCNRMLDPDKKRNFQRDTVMRAKHRGFFSAPPLPPSLPIMLDTIRLVVGERITAEEVAWQKA